MFDAMKVAKAEEHLRQVWKVLLGERERILARAIEGILAELTDESLEPSERRRNAAREWNASMSNPRGLPDYGVWREDQGERQRLNSEFEAHLTATSKLLS